MVSVYADGCGKCGRGNPIAFSVVPEEAFRTVVLNRWCNICPGCFDAAAEKAGVRYTFEHLDGVPCSDRPAPRQRSKRRR